MKLNGAERCCICGEEKVSYHNPEPVRDGELDCCDACNRLVIKARNQMSALPREEHAAYVLQLRSMTYAELAEAFGADHE